MIRLELKGKQCDDCPCFSPISETAIIRADGRVESVDKIIKCKNDDLCASLMDYLEKHRCIGGNDERINQNQL